MGTPPSHWLYLHLPHVAVILAVVLPFASLVSAEDVHGIAADEDFVQFGHRLQVNASKCGTGLSSSPVVLHVSRPHLDLRAGPATTLRVVNAGLGTTATHAIHRALCRSGISSVHWDDHCHLEGEALQRHREVVGVYEQIKSCANRTLGKFNRLCSVQRVRRQLRSALVALASSGVVAASDSPYTDLMPELLAMNPALKVVQTLRDADEWVGQRLGNHGEDTLCKAGIESFSLFDCIDGHDWLGDAFSTQGELHGAQPQALKQFSTSFALHNQRIAGMVPPEQLWQMCAWDEGFADNLAALAVSLNAPVRLPPKWLVATPNEFMSSPEPKRFMQIRKL